MRRAAVTAPVLAILLRTVAPLHAAVEESVPKLPPQITRASALENFDFVWERIRDTHFDPTFNGIDWYGVRDEFRPVAAGCRHIDSLRVVLWRMLGRLEQSHFGIIPSGRYDTGGDDSARRLFSAVPGDVARPGPGIDVRHIDGAFVVTDVWDDSSAGDVGVERGWELLAVDGSGVDTLVAGSAAAMRRVRGAGWSPQETPHFVWTTVQGALAGGDGTDVALTFRNPRGDTVALTVERRPCPWPTVSPAAGIPALPLHVKGHRLETDAGVTVGVVAIHFFWLPGTAAAVEDAVDALGEVDAVVVDIRGNLGGVSTAMKSVASYFTGETLVLGKTVAREGEMPLMVHPRRIGLRGGRVRPFTGPMAVLTDGLTGSASELFAAGLRDAGRVRVFGAPTAGAALPAIVSPMPNGDALLHAAFDFVRPAGESLEGRPLEPDVYAPLTRRALERDGDPALETAVTWLVETLRAR